MNCPNCGTYNPDERDVCWRCDKPLPRPEPKKKRDPQKQAQTWLYVVVAVFVAITVLQMCGFKLPGMQQPAQQQPGGYVAPRAPATCSVAFEWVG